MAAGVTTKLWDLTDVAKVIEDRGGASCHAFRRSAHRVRKPSAEAQAMNEPDFPIRAKVEVPLLRFIVENEGRINLSKIGCEMEIELAKQLGISDADRDFSSPNYRSEGHRKWRNEIQFVRDRLVRSGDLAGNSMRGWWDATEQGYRRLGMVKPTAPQRRP